MSEDSKIVELLENQSKMLAQIVEAIGGLEAEVGKMKTNLDELNHNYIAIHHDVKALTATTNTLQERVCSLEAVSRYLRY